MCVASISTVSHIILCEILCEWHADVLGHLSALHRELETDMLRNTLSMIYALMMYMMYVYDGSCLIKLLAGCTKRTCTCITQALSSQTYVCAKVGY